MSSLRDLYQEVIMDHNRNPRNKGTLEDASHKGEGFNPLCGDEIQLYLYVNKDLIIEKILLALLLVVKKRESGMILDQHQAFFQIKA